MNGQKVIDGDVPLNLNIKENGTILIISNDQSYLTHGIHKFPAKFFPELPRYLIRKYSKSGETVLDPMCGSGTVILEAMLEGRNAVGVDIDPIAEMISTAKTTPINSKTLEKCRNIIFREILKKVSSNYEPKIPDFNYREKWFEPFVLRELSIIKESIDSIKANGYTKSEAERLHRFFSVVFSSIVRDVSNADPHCTRTVIRKKLKKNTKEWDAVLKFLANAEKQIDHMQEFYDKYNSFGSKPRVRIIKSDARKTGIKPKSIDLAVTSPPYCNAVDYPRTHQLEMYWLGLTNGGTLADMKRNYIGTETVYSNEYSEVGKTGYKQLDAFVSDLFKKDKRISFIVYKFFVDMEKNLKEVHSLLKDGGRYCVVIGNNTIKGSTLKSHEIIRDIATSENVGFKLDKIFFSGVIKHFIKIPRKERMPGEWVIILEKPLTSQ